MAGGLAGSVVSSFQVPRSSALVPRSFRPSYRMISLDKILPDRELTAFAQTVLVVKYVMPDYPDSFGISYGVAGVIQSSK